MNDQLLNSPKEIELALERTLLQVQKPGRYIGGELNQIIRSWDLVDTKVLLAFPDIYDIGLPNLGLAILYEIINRRKDTIAERVYAPWLDMESVMRKNRIPLFSLESKHPASDFDVVAFTMPYESIYTNILNMLDLAAIPVYAHDRTEQDPIILAGGHAAFNPEPMAEFIDVFVIGDGEYAINTILDTINIQKSKNASREKIIESLITIPGVYIPKYYQPEYHQNGTIKGVTTLHPMASAQIFKNLAPDIPVAPTKPLVPNIDVVHNRIAVEIMRGCTRGCRFCHAGFINRPVRERSVEEILKIIEESITNTGYEEVALLSLSSSDYSHIDELIDVIQSKFAGKNLNISLPSLRIESFSIDLMEKIRTARPGGFTLAPEAATDHMRRTINKPIEETALLNTVTEIYKRGWQTVKLYFMIGQPEETDEDVIAIAELCDRVLAAGRKAIGNRANLNVGIATFVPKPHTPFQWAPMNDQETIARKHRLLREHIRSRAIKISLSYAPETLVESMLTRGDRHLSTAIYLAWKKGAKFDAWRDQFKKDIWFEAFNEAQISPEFYALRLRSDQEIFPWDLIHPGVNKSFLLEEYHRSKSEELRQDCREQCFACGILPHYRELRGQNPGENWKCPEIIINR